MVDGCVLRRVVEDCEGSSGSQHRDGTASSEFLPKSKFVRWSTPISCHSGTTATWVLARSWEPPASMQYPNLKFCQVWNCRI